MRRSLSAAALVLGLAASGAQAAPDPPVPTAQTAVPFEACRADLATWATGHGIPQAFAGETLLALTPDPDVLAATRSQGEFVKPIWAYLDGAITEGRIAEGQRKLAEWAPTLDAIEQKYGVDRYTLVAFWGVESSYGAVLDDPGVVRPVIRSLATLACARFGPPA